MGAEELSMVKDEDVRIGLAEQLLAKLQRKKRAFQGGKNSEFFEAAAGGPIDEVLRELADASPSELAK